MSRGGQLLCDTKKCQVSGYKSKFAELSSSESEGEELSEPLKENLQNRLNREAFKKTLVNKQNKARQVPVSVIPNQQIQFSTLSLDQNQFITQSSFEHQQLINLKKQNNKLRDINQKLSETNAILLQRLTNFQSQPQPQNQTQLLQLLDELNESQHKAKKYQKKLKQVQKQYQNKLINQQLMLNKSPKNDSKRIYSEISEYLRRQVGTFIDKLKKFKMLPQVAEIVEQFAAQILKVDVERMRVGGVVQHEGLSRGETRVKQQPGRKSVDVTNSVYVSRSQADQSILSVVSGKSKTDYRLLEKSIDKLREMERQIDCAGMRSVGLSDDMKYYSPIVLDRSNLSEMERSKSQRRKIFQ